jgi:hypothetical protein
MFNRDKQQTDAESRDLAQRFSRFAARQSDADPLLGERRRATATGRLTDLLATPSVVAGDEPAAAVPQPSAAPALPPLPPLAAALPVTADPATLAASDTLTNESSVPLTIGKLAEVNTPAAPLTPVGNDATLAAPPVGWLTPPAQPLAVDFDGASAPETRDDPDSWAALQNAVGLTPAAEHADDSDAWPPQPDAAAVDPWAAPAGNDHTADPWTVVSPAAGSGVDAWSAAVADDRAAALDASAQWRSPALNDDRTD